MGHRLGFEGIVLLLLIAILRRVARHDEGLTASDKELIRKAEEWTL